MRLLAILLLMMLGLSLCPSRLAHAGSYWGLRGGFAADGKDENALQFEGFGAYHLPWDLRNRGGWGVSTQMELTAGILRSKGEYGFVGSLGPSFGIGNPRYPVQVDIGISVAILSRDKFGSRDYNGIEQFISHAGLIYRINRHLGLSYRFQHMSNAGFNGSPNPGLNMHLLGANWYFSR